MKLLLKENKQLLILPALLSFIITLLLLYKYSYPISWDVYYHIHMIDLYMQKGLVFWDYNTVSPKGRLIMYPPLLHIILAQIAQTLNIAPIELIRLAQPLFSAYLIGTITLTTYKLTDVKTAFITGFLSMLCFVTFNRSVICTPATIAIGLFLISTTYCYKGINEESTKQIIISATALALIWNLHMATAILTSGTIGVYFLVQFTHKNWNIKYILIYITIMLLIGLPWWIYIATNYQLVFNSLSGFDTDITNFFFRYYGIIPTILLITGYYTLIKEKNTLKTFLITTSITLILLSQIKYLGFNTVSIRILEVASYPMIIISGIGLTKIYDKIQSPKLKNTLIITLILISTLTALLYVDSYTPDILDDNDNNKTVINEEIHKIINPIKTIFKPTIISSRFADTTLAHDRYKVMQYFIEKNTTQMLVSEDAIMDTIIVSTSRTPVVYGGFTESIPEYVTDPVHIIKGWSNKEELQKLNIGYILLRKDTQVPYYAQTITENNHYKICKIKEEYR